MSGLKPLAATLLIAGTAGLTGCVALFSGSLRVDVDVYKGPLSMEEDAQRAEMAGLIVGVPAMLEGLDRQFERSQCALGCITTTPVMCEDAPADPSKDKRTPGPCRPLTPTAQSCLELQMPMECTKEEKETGPALDQALALACNAKTLTTESYVDRHVKNHKECHDIEGLRSRVRQLVDPAKWLRARAVSTQFGGLFAPSAGGSEKAAETDDGVASMVDNLVRRLTSLDEASDELLRDVGSAIRAYESGAEFARYLRTIDDANQVISSAPPLPDYADLTVYVTATNISDVKAVVALTDQNKTALENMIRDLEQGRLRAARTIVAHVDHADSVSVVYRKVTEPTDEVLVAERLTWPQLANLDRLWKEARDGHERLRAALDKTIEVGNTLLEIEKADQSLQAIKEHWAVIETVQSTTTALDRLIADNVKASADFPVSPTPDLDGAKKESEAKKIKVKESAASLRDAFAIARKDPTQVRKLDDAVGAFNTAVGDLGTDDKPEGLKEVESEAQDWKDAIKEVPKGIPRRLESLDEAVTDLVARINDRPPERRPRLSFLRSVHKASAARDAATGVKEAASALTGALKDAVEALPAHLGPETTVVQKLHGSFDEIKELLGIGVATANVTLTLKKKAEDLKTKIDAPNTEAGLRKEFHDNRAKVALKAAKANEEEAFYQLQTADTRLSSLQGEARAMLESCRGKADQDCRNHVTERVRRQAEERQVLELALALANQFRALATDMSFQWAAAIRKSTRVRIDQVKFANLMAELSNHLSSRADSLMKQGEGLRADRFSTGGFLRDSATTAYTQAYDWLDASAGKDEIGVKERTQLVQRLFEDGTWARVNEVYASGTGKVSMAFVKDDIGNWNLKAFENDPTAMLDAFKSVAFAGLKAARKLAKGGGVGAVAGKLAVANAAFAGDSPTASVLPAGLGFEQQHQQLLDELQLIDDAYQKREIDKNTAVQQIKGLLDNHTYLVDALQRVIVHEAEKR